MRTRSLSRAAVVAALVPALVPASASRAQTPSTYWIELAGFHVYATRSQPSDAISLAYTVSLNGRDYPVQTFAPAAPVTAPNDYTVPLGAPPAALEQFRLAVAPSDTVVVKYALVSAHGADERVIAQDVLRRYAAGGGQPAADDTGTIWPQPFARLVKPATAFLANCDGVVAADAFTVGGGQIAHWIADNKGPALTTHNYEGPPGKGCGVSNYDVTIRFRAL